jgi:hypothetical protein
MDTLLDVVRAQLLVPVWNVLYYWNSLHFFSGMTELGGHVGKSNASICALLRHGEESEYQYLHRDGHGTLILTEDNNPAFIPTPTCNAFLENCVVSRTLFLATVLVIMVSWWALHHWHSVLSVVVGGLKSVLQRCYIFYSGSGRHHDCGTLDNERRKLAEARKKSKHFHDFNAQALRNIAIITFSKGLTPFNALYRIALIRDMLVNASEDIKTKLQLPTPNGHDEVAGTPEDSPTGLICDGEGHQHQQHPYKSCGDQDLQFASSAAIASSVTSSSVSAHVTCVNEGKAGPHTH